MMRHRIALVGIGYGGVLVGIGVVRHPVGVGHLIIGAIVMVASFIAEERWR